MEQRDTSDKGFQAPFEMIEHEVLEFAVTEDYYKRGIGYGPISPYSMKLMDALNNQSEENKWHQIAVL